MTHFLTHELYGKRPTGHLDAYRVEPGHWFLEVAGWTLEVEPGPRLERLMVAVFGRQACAEAPAVAQ